MKEPLDSHASKVVIFKALVFQEWENQCEFYEQVSPHQILNNHILCSFFIINSNKTHTDAGPTYTLVRMCVG